MEQDDDSDSDTSMDSQIFHEELFITEDDELSGEASDPLLPQRERSLEISLDYSKIIEPLDEDSSPDEFLRAAYEDVTNEAQFLTSIEVPNVVQLPTEETPDHKLAEDFEEFMKYKRKNVNEIVGQNIQEFSADQSLASLQSEEVPIEKAIHVTNLEANNSDVSTKLPDIIQTVEQGNRDTEAENVGNADKYISETFMHVTNYELENKNLEPKTEFFTNTTIPETDFSETAFTRQEPLNMQAEAEPCEVTHDLPWLCYLGLASGSTLLASYTNMSPLYYVLAWVAISFLSFQFCTKEERVLVT